MKVIAHLWADLSEHVAGAQYTPFQRAFYKDALHIPVIGPQTFVAMIAPGLAAEITVCEFPQRSFAAEVASIAGALDPASRTLLTEVRMRDEGDLLRPGIYADVKFHLTHDNPPLIIPASALILRSGTPRVATVGADNKVRFQLVQLGRDYGTTVEVVAGLSEKYPLLVAPPDDLQDGQLVRTLTAPVSSNAKSD